MTPERVALGLGSNVGDREAHLARAIAALHALPWTGIAGVSGFHETAPVGPVVQGPFLNACVALVTALSPMHLLHELHAIERAAGRDRAREQRWGPRTLDLDVLLWGDRQLDLPGLHVPHPRMHERAFVLTPLLEVWPSSAIIPGSALTLGAAHARAALLEAAKGDR